MVFFLLFSINSILFSTSKHENQLILINFAPEKALKPLKLSNP